MIPPKGDFSFIKNTIYSISLHYDYNVVEKNNLWEFFKNYNGKSFMSTLTEVDNYDWYPQHSGSSWSLSMKAMELIAKKGWEHFVQSQMM